MAKKPSMKGKPTDRVIIKVEVPLAWKKEAAEEAARLGVDLSTWLRLQIRSALDKRSPKK